MQSRSCQSVRLFPCGVREVRAAARPRLSSASHALGKAIMRLSLVVRGDLWTPTLEPPGAEPEVPGGRGRRSSAPAPSHVGGDDLLGVAPSGGGEEVGKGGGSQEIREAR